MRKIALLALALAASSAFAQNLLGNGDTTGQPTFNRPTTMVALSGVGTAVPYVAIPFWVTVTGNYVMEVNGVSHTDTYALLYVNSFTAATPLVNLQDGDDDFSGTFTVLSGTGQGFASSRIASTETTNFNDPAGSNLLADTQYYLVVTGFGNTDFGTFNYGIGGGQGQVNAGSPVPEPATMVVLAGMAVAAAARRRRN